SYVTADARNWKAVAGQSMQIPEGIGASIEEGEQGYGSLDGLTVINNVVINTSAGFSRWVGHTGTPNTNFTIANNTLINNDYEINIANTGAGTSGLNFKNNIVYHTRSSYPGYTFQVNPTPTGSTFSNN